MSTPPSGPATDPAASASGVDALAARVHEVHEFLRRNEALSAQTAFGSTSSFWAGMFDSRPNYPGLNDLLTIRRSRFLTGVGDYGQTLEADAREFFDRTAYILAPSISPGFVRSIAEPVFGAPFLFDVEGVRRSASFVLNAATTEFVQRVVHEAGLGGSALDVCEIGPGWGGFCYQLHQVVPVRSCTLVDLPQNLAISSCYLSTVLPDRRLELVDVAGEPLGATEPMSLNAMLPAGVLRVGQCFDLVVNSFSLQEMDLDTVQSYVDWIARHLKPGGRFVSLNAHGKAGVRWPSDYRYSQFRLAAFRTFRRYPTGLFNTIPYAAVLAPAEAASKGPDPELLDALGHLMQFGLDGDLDDLRNALVAGAIDARQDRFLRACLELFRADSDDARLGLLRTVDRAGFETVAAFLEGNLAYAIGDDGTAMERLQAAASAGLDGFALARAHFLAATLARRLDAAMPFDPCRAYPEAATAVARRDRKAATEHINRLFGRQPRRLLARLGSRRAKH